MTAHLMLDIETLGTNPGDAIIAIGAICFRSAGQWADIITDPAPHHAFYVEINAASSAGQFVIDERTVYWWQQQSQFARDMFDRVYLHSVGQPIGAALDMLSTFVHSFNEGVCVWGNGSDFDNAMVKAAYNIAHQTPPPWSHRDNRCYRTLKSLMPETTFTPIEGAEHHAYYDALAQARHAQILLHRLGATAAL